MIHTLWACTGYPILLELFDFDIFFSLYYYDELGLLHICCKIPFAYFT
jgi:hypothetical protein